MEASVDLNSTQSLSAHSSPDALSDHSQFLSASFEPLAFAQRLVQETPSDLDRFEQVQGQLQAKIDDLQQTTRALITASQSELLDQIVGVRTVDSSLTVIEEQVREIRGYMHTLRSKIRVPHAQAVAYARQAANLQAAMRFARATARFMQLARRLRTQVPGALAESNERCDWAAAALTLADIDRTVASNGGLSGIVVVDNEMRDSVEPRRRRAQQAAEHLVANGIKKNSASDVGSGLVVLGNLGTLGETVASMVRHEASDWAAFVSTAPLNDPWTDIPFLLDELLVRGLQIRTLEKALARRRDVVARFDVSVDNVGFLDSVVAQLGDRALAFWWRAAVAVLSARILAAPTRAVVTTGFPRLVRAFFPKLEPLVLAHLGGVTTVREPSVNSPGGHEEDPGVSILWDGLLAPLAAEYCSRAATRMSGAVKRCFAQQQQQQQPMSVVPSRKNIVAAARRIASETQLAAADSRLSMAVLRCASDAVDEFMLEINARIAQITASVLPPMFSGEPHELLPVYAGLVNSVEALCAALRESDVSIELPDPFVLVEPLFASAQSEIAMAIDQDDLLTVELAMQWVQTQVIAPVELKLYPRTLSLVRMCIRRYVRLVLQTYPMTEDAKLHVVASVARFEFACSQLVALADTGDAYAGLRLLRPLLFMDVKELCKTVEDGKVLGCLPTVDLLGFIIYRIATEAGLDSEKEMVLPHALLGWSLDQLQEHLLGRLQGSLDTVMDAQRRSLNKLAQMLQTIISPEYHSLALCALDHFQK
ncbi:Conserved oligomeric Golgi complex subunit [Coemansia erecta]|nr:Conserved oligomeric Golgi complex subunit [Coemansia erecta]KAJ2888325.1 Conserved oligomeric Golgi complex subunit [Coemansia asiatica]